MTVKIQGKEIELFYTMRLHIIYENITGESIDFENMKSLKQITTLLMSCIIGSAQKQNIQLNLTYNEFMDWLDDNGGYGILTEFTIWLSKELQSKYSLLAEKVEKEQKESKKRKKAKD